MRQIIVSLFCIALFVFSGTTVPGASSDLLPCGNSPAAAPIPHFPDNMYAFVWRSWNLAPIERMARVLQTDRKCVEEIAQLMGLPEYKKPVWPESRIYITLLRRNWHILPYEQLLVLLDMSAERLAFHLKEDDFLFSKLGNHKPACKPVVYHAPTASDKVRLAQIATINRHEFQDSLDSGPSELPFGFIADLAQSTVGQSAVKTDSPRFSLRFIHSYFALFGDPLMDDHEELYPDWLLQRYADCGVNGVWLHVVLRDLAPATKTFPEFGHGHEKRIAKLRQLVDKAKKYGIGVYLYMNEPRCMPRGFFENRENVAGAPGYMDSRALCTSSPEVRKWLGDSLSYVFGEIPELAGIFTITACENYTHCYSTCSATTTKCPRCSKRGYEEVLAEVNSIMEEAVHRVSPEAKVIVWDWFWKRNAVTPELIALLPKNVYLMSVSEWSIPLCRGGVETKVSEYSISAVGPGPRAKRQWELARARGLNTAAKIQLGTTWEAGSVPFIPAMELVAEHCRRLATSGVDALMLSWSLGGWPGPNLKLVRMFDRDPLPTTDQALDRLALECFGQAGAAKARQGWKIISRGFEHFPYTYPGSLYYAPVHTGPSNLLYLKSPGFRATMVGIPYDDLARWIGPFPPEVFVKQMTTCAKAFMEGAKLLDEATSVAPHPLRKDSARQGRYARVCGINYASTCNQIRFIEARKEWLDSKSPQRRMAARDTMKQCLQSEIDLARELYVLCRTDSAIGFEATNQYWFVPQDLIEKVINCRWLLTQLENNSK